MKRCYVYSHIILAIVTIILLASQPTVVRHQIVVTRNFAASMEQLTIVHLSDLHFC